MSMSGKSEKVLSPPHADKANEALEAGQVTEDVYIDPEVERRTIAKFDLYMMPQMMILQIVSYLDRTNIGNAKVFGFAKDLDLGGNRFGNVSTLFYPTYVVFEIFWVMMVKKFGANIVLAIALFGWSSVTLGTAFITNYTQALVMRVLLGLFEAALFPCLAFVVSTVYSRQKQAKRIAVLYGGAAISGAFGGLIAYGIQIRGERNGLAAWRWLFIVEGIISFVVAICIWFTLPCDATKAWFLKPEEREVMRLRRQRDAEYTGDDEFSWEYVRMAFSDPLIYIAAIAFFCATVPFFGFATFLPPIIQGLGYNSLQANYLSIPVYIFACISLAFNSWLSDKLQQRAYSAMAVTMPVMLGYAIVLGTPSSGAGLFAMFLVGAGIYAYNTLMVTWISANLRSEHIRSVGIPLLVCLANISGICSSQIYPSTDAPRYIKGNAISLALEVVASVGIGAIWLLLRWRNRARAERIRRGEVGEKDEFVYVL